MSVSSCLLYILTAVCSDYDRRKPGSIACHVTDRLIKTGVLNLCLHVSYWNENTNCGGKMWFPGRMLSSLIVVK